jgi:hypothetical protein
VQFVVHDLQSRIVKRMQELENPVLVLVRSQEETDRSPSAGGMPILESSHRDSQRGDRAVLS